MVYGRDPQYFDQVDSRNENEMLRREISRIKEIISSFQQRLASQHQQTQDSPTEISSQSPINDPLTPQMESPSNPNDEWDEFPPDFFYSRGMTSCCRNMCPKSMDRLHQNIWNPDMSQLFAKCNRMSIENEQFHQENLVQQQDLGFPVPIVNARSILRSLGVSESNFNLKRNLYAEVVVRKGIVRLANPEFLALIRAPIDEVIGMSIRDIIPKGFEQYISYVLHREMMASGKTSLLFECICGRKDGTCFRSFVNWTQFHDDEDRVVQEIMAFHLCSVEDLDVPPVDVPIEKTKPPLSLESEYPDSPCTGD